MLAMAGTARQRASNGDSSRRPQLAVDLVAALDVGLVFAGAVVKFAFDAAAHPAGEQRPDQRRQRLGHRQLDQRARATVLVAAPEARADRAPPVRAGDDGVDDAAVRLVLAL